MPKECEISELKRILAYDADTGVLTWLWRDDWPYPTNRKYAGREAGGLWERGGYKTYVVRVFGELYQSHRVAWALHYGTWPVGELDHANGDATDNRISNLREATRSNQMANTKARGPHPKGVCWDKSRNKFAAKIKAAGKTINLGRFDDAEEAALAYEAAADCVFGEFMSVRRA